MIQSRIMLKHYTFHAYTQDTGAFMLSDMQIQRLMDIALAACQKGLAGQAREIYAAVLTVKPAFAPAIIGLSFSRLVVDEFDVAEELLCREVLDKNPKDADALLILGLCRTLAGRHMEARQTLEAARAVLPTADRECATPLADALLEKLC